MFPQWALPCLSLRPSWPALFLPQPNTAPDKERAKLWSPPAVICAKGIPARDLRGCGNSLLGSSLPRPSWPLVFWPHVNSWPSNRGKTHSTVLDVESVWHKEGTQFERHCVFHTSRKCNAVLIPAHYLGDLMVTQPFYQSKENKKKHFFIREYMNNINTTNQHFLSE